MCQQQTATLVQCAFCEARRCEVRRKCTSRLKLPHRCPATAATAGHNQTVSAPRNCAEYRWKFSSPIGGMESTAQSTAAQGDAIGAYDLPSLESVLVHLPSSYLPLAGVDKQECTAVEEQRKNSVHLDVLHTLVPAAATSVSTLRMLRSIKQLNESPVDAQDHPRFLLRTASGITTNANSC